MSLLFVVCCVVFVDFSHATESVIPPYDKNGEIAYMNIQKSGLGFELDLNQTKHLVSNLSTESEVDCELNCLEEVNCLSGVLVKLAEASYRCLLFNWSTSDFEKRLSRKTNTASFQLLTAACHLNNPCQNGGECIASAGPYNYLCNCTSGYSGRNCSQFLVAFTSSGSGRFGSIQSFVINKTGRYNIRTLGARGGTHNYSYGYKPGRYLGGRGASMEGNFLLSEGTKLNIVVGQRGGDSVEVRDGQVTTLTAAQLGLSIENQAGTGGGGGSFVYNTANVLLIAAGGGGGASAGYNGTDGQSGTNGTASQGTDPSRTRSGGTNGNPGMCNSAGGDYHGGVGAGWLGQGCARAGSSHGGPGGSRDQGWVGGQAGSMNSGFNGGPAPGAVGGFGGGGGGSEDNGASGGGVGYSGGGSGTHAQQAGGGGGSYCGGSNCKGVTGDNNNDNGKVFIYY